MSGSPKAKDVIEVEVERDAPRRVASLGLSAGEGVVAMRGLKPVICLGRVECCCCTGTGMGSVAAVMMSI